jgi:hypothetical protein
MSSGAMSELTTSMQRTHPVQYAEHAQVGILQQVNEQLLATTAIDAK